MSFILGVDVFGQLLHTMFAARWFILLYRWVNVVAVSSLVDRGVIFFLRCYRCFCRGGIWSGAYAVALVASRGSYPLLHPSVPRHCFLWVYPPYIYIV